MNVLMIEWFLPESSYTLELAKELKKHTQLTVFCQKNAGADMKGIRWMKKLYGGGKNKAAAMAEYAAGLWKMRQEICRGRYDVVHVQNFKNARYEIPIYCREKGSAGLLVHTVHNLLPHEAVRSDRELYQRFYDTCDLLLVHNEFCKKQLMQDFQVPEKKVQVIPHGAYTLVEKEVKKPHSHEKIQFLQFGILRNYKGIDILLKAVSLLSEETRNQIHVTVAGAQFPKLDKTDYGQMIKELDIGDCVTLRNGYIPEKELGMLYGETDFCVFPYRHIYGSGALLMAYSYEKPVIASDIPVFREETEDGETGLLFASEDPKALKEALEKAVTWTKEQYETCQGRIRKLTEEKYSWKTAALNLAEAYQKYGNKKEKK